MKTGKLIVELNDIRIDHSLSEDQEYVVDEIIERLIVYEELKKRRFEAFVEKKAKKR